MGLLKPNQNPRASQIFSWSSRYSISFQKPNLFSQSPAEVVEDFRKKLGAVIAEAGAEINRTKSPKDDPKI